MCTWYYITRRLGRSAGRLAAGNVRGRLPRASGGSATSFRSRPPVGRAVAVLRSPATDARWRSGRLQVAAFGRGCGAEACGGRQAGRQPVCRSPRTRRAGEAGNLAEWQPAKRARREHRERIARPRVRSWSSVRFGPGRGNSPISLAGTTFCTSGRIEIVPSTSLTPPLRQSQRCFRAQAGSRPGIYSRGGKTFVPLTNSSEESPAARLQTSKKRGWRHCVWRWVA
jgi:hypothetical protein